VESPVVLPSAALVLVSSPTPPSPVTIIVKPGGPYVVQGSVAIRDREGNALQPPLPKVPGTVKLCACGHSKTHPFCDGTHKTLRDASVPTTPSPADR